jgi:hypothetical protein
LLTARVVERESIRDEGRRGEQAALGRRANDGV